MLTITDAILPSKPQTTSRLDSIQFTDVTTNLDVTTTTRHHNAELRNVVIEPVQFDYASLRTVSNAMGERHDCAVIAICVVANEPYPKIHEMLRRAGRRSRCGTPWLYVRKVIKELNLAMHDISGYYEGASVRSIAPQLPDKGNFLVSTHKHVAAVRDGVVHDWSEQRKLYVKHVYKVTDLEEPYPMPERRRRRVVIDYLMPTKAVWTIADILMEDVEATANTMSRKWWSSFRAKVVAECMANGINKTTASVQVGKWMNDQGFHMSTLV